LIRIYILRGKAKERYKMMKHIDLTGGLLRVLEGSQIKQIHETAIHILEEVGMETFSKQVLEFLKQKGAKIKNSSKVFFSREMVESAISSAPNSVLLAGQAEEYDLCLEKNRVFLGTGGVGLNILDVETNHRRPATLSDLADIARLCDYLENIHFFVRPIEPPSLLPPQLDLYKFYIALANTRKHVMGCVYTKESAKAVIEMASLIAGGLECLRERPFISFISAIISPLRYEPGAAELLIEIVKHGLPVALPSSPITGSTGPATLAGSMALAHAETLAGLVLCQFVRPGTPVLYGPIPRPVNWRSMGVLKGGVESGMMNAALAQMAAYIEIPQYADAGGTEATAPNIQAGYEKAVNILLVALAGGNYIHHAAGLLDSDILACLEQYVIDNDIIGMVVQVLKGLKVNEETLAFEVVRRVGPGGNFLTDDHTMRNLRSGEIFVPCSASRNDSVTPLEKASAKVKDILENHWIEVINEKTDKKIREQFNLRVKRTGKPI